MVLILARMFFSKLIINTKSSSLLLLSEVKSTPIMFNVTNFFKERKFFLPSEELQLLQDFIDDKIKPGPAAKLLTKNNSIKNQTKLPLHDISDAILCLAVFSLDSAIQIKCVELALAIRDLPKSLLNPRNKTLPGNILGEMTQVLGEWWECEYLVPSFDLPSNTGC